MLRLSIPPKKLVFLKIGGLQFYTGNRTDYLALSKDSSDFAAGCQVFVVAQHCAVFIVSNTVTSPRN